MLPAPIASVAISWIDFRGRVALFDAREVHRMSVGGRVEALRREAGEASE